MSAVRAATSGRWNGICCVPAVFLFFDCVSQDSLEISLVSACVHASELDLSVEFSGSSITFNIGVKCDF